MAKTIEMNMECIKAKAKDLVYMCRLELDLTEHEAEQEIIALLHKRKTDIYDVYDILYNKYWRLAGDAIEERKKKEQRLKRENEYKESIKVIPKQTNNSRISYQGKYEPRYMTDDDMKFAYEFLEVMAISKKWPKGVIHEYYKELQFSVQLGEHANITHWPTTQDAIKEVIGLMSDNSWETPIEILKQRDQEAKQREQETELRHKQETEETRNSPVMQIISKLKFS
jgi:hypothetical protein